MAVAKEGDRKQFLWKLIAFVTRYGHTSFDSIKGFTIRELNDYADGIGSLLEDENASYKQD